MKISQNWLREFVDFRSSPAELSEALNMLGIEVEGFEDRTKLYERFVTARVVTKEKHPKADKLSVCRVFDGLEERTVVCGAPNVDAGQIVVFARPGAVVPHGGFEISSRVLRGVESNGMICSRAELNLSDDTQGIWVLDPFTLVGEDIGSALGLADVIYDISITPNRADALSHLGIARVIAAYEKIPLTMPKVTVVESDNAIDCRVQIKDAVSCPRYMARVVRNVTVTESPLWLQQRLESVGLRPRNVIVDISNYVLMECGHPLHAFDYDRVHNKTVVVQCANDSETFLTLDDKSRTLDSETLMICDDADRIAVAGIMGGAHSAINETTTNVLIESAYFRPSSIRRSARRLGISSDASYRFERGTDINVLRYAVDRAAQLMAELAGGRVDRGVIDEYPQAVGDKVIRLRFERVRSVLGFEVSDDAIVDIVERLECHVTERSSDSVTLHAPSYRVDLNEEIDMVEEIAILSHYDNIPLVAEGTVSYAGKAMSPAFREPEAKSVIRHYLAARGLHEIVTQNQTDPMSESLVEGDGVELANPLGEELSLMRSSLVPSMIRVVGHNIRLGAASVKLFDIAKTFHARSEAQQPIAHIVEKSALCIAISGLDHDKSWYEKSRALDFFDLKGLVESLAAELALPLTFASSAHAWFTADQCAILLEGTVIGSIGTVAKPLLKRFDCDSDVFVAHVDLEPVYAFVKKEAKYSPASTYPLVERDLAFVVPTSVSAAQLESLIVQSGSAILRDVYVFDLFEHQSLGQDRKSLAFRLVFSSHERTLTDGDVDAVITTIIGTVTDQAAATLRS